MAELPALVDRPAVARPNRGGRPRKQDKFAALYAATEAQLHALLPLVPVALRELVAGVWVEEFVGREHARRVYQQPPNILAIRELLDRTVGKTPVRVAVNGAVDHRVVVVELTVAERARLLALALGRVQAELEQGD